VAAAKMPLEEAALVAGTKQNLRNIPFLDIYACKPLQSRPAFKVILEPAP